MNEHDAWKRATTLAAMGDLTARWVEQEADYTPSYADGPPDPETAEIARVLAEVNRAGFVTEFSQPAELEDGWAQRAAVSGYCSEARAWNIARTFWPTEVVAMVRPPGCMGGESMADAIAITLSDGDAHTWLRGVGDLRGDLLIAGCDVAASVIGAAWFVEAFDPVWGRHDLLWDTLRSAVLIDLPEWQHPHL